MCSLEVVKSKEDQQLFLSYMGNCKIECLPTFVRIINVADTSLQFHRLIVNAYGETVGFVSYVFVPNGNIADCCVIGAYVDKTYRHCGYFKEALVLLEGYGSPVVLMLSGLPSKEWLQTTSVSKYKIV